MVSCEKVNDFLKGFAKPSDVIVEGKSIFVENVKQVYKVGDTLYFKIEIPAVAFIEREK